MPSPLPLINSEDKLFEVMEKTDAHLRLNDNALQDKICEIIWIQRSLSELLPETIERFWSGHTFPLIEAECELECSIQFLRMGFYKHSFVCLRNILELGLLSVYWDIDGTSHIDIQTWLRSIESTPFKKKIFQRIRKQPNVRIFDDEHRFFDEVTALYNELSDYAHTRGMKFSSQRLNNSNFSSFNEKSLEKYLQFLEHTVQVIVIFHVLLYPVALQYTPLVEKFGINGPVGGFLRPEQMESIKNLLPDKVLDTLQSISDSDPYAISASAGINKMPDITNDEVENQIEQNDKDMIEMQGYQNWLKNERMICKHLKQNHPVEYSKKLKYLRSMRKWAAENDYLYPPWKRKAR